MRKFLILLEEEDAERWRALQNSAMFLSRLRYSQIMLKSTQKRALATLWAHNVLCDCLSGPLRYRCLFLVEFGGRFSAFCLLTFEISRFRGSCLSINTPTKNLGVSIYYCLGRVIQIEEIQVAGGMIYGSGLRLGKFKSRISRVRR